MSLAPGTRLGTYEIQSALGVGGMGEVYRAADRNLKRAVALKVLPAPVAADAERLARFQREAEVLAALNHPNIAAIYGLEKSDGVTALVMELVDGPTLADRIIQGSVPIEEALTIARQIADALEAAHEQNIIHRDVKPANIKVRPDGTVKVLDFGLAKALEVSSASNTNVTQSPTITTPAMMTGAGVILGTAAYMSPEQARGKSVDRKTDIWAFGCVLYEMLTGKRAFEGENASDTLASILRSEPDWQALPSDTPPAIVKMLRRALQKDARARMPHIAVARLEIDDATSAPREAVPIGVATRLRGQLSIWSAMLALAAVVATIFAVRVRLLPLQPQTTRLDITTPPTTDPVSMAVAPDGRKVLFVADVDGHPHLWLRELNSAAAQPLANTKDAAYPFWSPDGRSIGFFANGRLLRLDLDGGAVRPLATAALGRGGTWNANGTILFAATALGGLLRVAESGGPATVATKLRSQEAAHMFPSFLPDGRQFLYFVAATPDISGIYVGTLDSPNARRLVDADAAALYDGNGHLLFVRQGTLYAQSFDAAKATLPGSAAPVAPSIAVRGGSVNVAAVSAANGTIIYRTGIAGGIHQFVVLNRKGEPAAPPRERDPDFPQNPSLSLDGRRILVSRILNGNGDIWMLDFSRSSQPIRVTNDPTPETYPKWAPDNDRFVFTRGADLFIRSLTEGTEQHFLSRSDVDANTAAPSGLGITATDWSRDGKYILTRINSSKTGLDLLAVEVSSHKILPVAQLPANEREGQFSPDIKWVAYQSNESGRQEIYIKRFPEGTNKIGVSTDGGSQVRWRGDGRELYYVALDGKLMAVPTVLDANGRLEAGAPAPLFATHIGPAVPAGFHQQYAVSSDGRTFFMNNIIDETSTTPITVLLHWHP